jgi:hypothetical protein
MIHNLVGVQRYVINRLLTRLLLKMLRSPSGFAVGSWQLAEEALRELRY